jgi:hypothetical protein
MDSQDKRVQMDVTPVGTHLTKIVLSGLLDTPGVDHIEARLVAIVVPASKSAVVDLSGVEFIASMEHQDVHHCGAESGDSPCQTGN